MIAVTVRMVITTKYPMILYPAKMSADVPA